MKKIIKLTNATSISMLRQKRYSRFFNSTWILLLVITVFMWQCKKDDFDEITTKCPVVVSTNPTNGATGVPLSQIIMPTFNQRMDPVTITPESFTLQEGTSPVSGTVSYTDSTASLRPSVPLMPFTTYTGRVKTTVKNLFRSSIQEDYVWTFKTIPQLTLSSNPVEGGNANGAGTFIQGSTATVTATAYSGYTFINWTDGGIEVSQDSIFHYQMNGNKTLVANFTNQYVVILLASPVEGGSTSGWGLYNNGSLVNAVATPNPGFTFSNWTENGTVVSTDANFTFTISGNRTLISQFTAIQKNSYTLNVTANNGTVGKNPDQVNYNSGSIVSLTPTAAAGYTFSSWSGDASGTANPLSVTMNSNKMITANFTAVSPTTYTLNVTAVNGTVAKNPNQVNYNSGSIVSLTPTAAAGYTFSSWSGDASGTANPLSVNMNSNKNITANFTAIAPNTFTLDVTAINGSVNKNPNNPTYLNGAIVLLTPTPNIGYTFTSWGGDALGSDNPLSVTMDADKAITANFSINTYLLTVISSNGDVVKNPTQLEYNYGENVELTATPNSGYVFDSWSGDALGSTNPVTVLMDK
jgi:uncharacterized repeat protein (TIGR02543 family)